MPGPDRLPGPEHLGHVAPGDPAPIPVDNPLGHLAGVTKRRALLARPHRQKVHTAIFNAVVTIAVSLDLGSEFSCGTVAWTSPVLAPEHNARTHFGADEQKMSWPVVGLTPRR
jgi:hypothetical protein